MTRRARHSAAKTVPFACAHLVALGCALLLAAPAQAQGLEPPPPLPPYPPASSGSLPNTPVMPPSSSDDSQDSGLGLEWVWINADVGASYVNLQSFSESNLGIQTTEVGGPAFGIGAGVRLLFLTLGIRARDLLLSSIGSLWEIGAEAAFHTRIWRIDPYFGFRGGYNFVGGLSSDSVQVATGGSASDVSVHGFNVGPMIGIDFYLAKLISIGADVDAQFLFLQRPKPPLPPGVTEMNLPANLKTLYDNSGSSVGFSVTPTAHLGIHF